LALSQQYAKKDSENKSYVRSSKQQLARNCLIPIQKVEEAENIILELIDWGRINGSSNASKSNDFLACRLTDYSYLLVEKQRANMAVKHQKEAFDICAGYENNPETILEYSIHAHNMAWIYIEAKKYNEATYYLEKELEIREQLIDEGRE
jgi:hypothetical protein